MVNSGSFDSDVDRNEKDGFTQLNHIVETPQSVVSIHAVSGSLCENDFTTQTADSLPVSQAIEPTATKTEFKCNMSAEFVRVRDTNVEGTKEMRGKIEIQQKNKKVAEQIVKMRCLRNFKVEGKPSICCSVPLDRIPDVLKVCSSLIAAKTAVTVGEKSKEVMKNKEMCLYCDRTFIIPAMKQKHMNRFHSLKLSKFRNLPNVRRSLIKCWFCDLNTEKFELKQLFAHFVTEHSEKYFGCLECEIRFPTFHAIESHNTLMHSTVSPLRVSTEPVITSELKTGTHEDTTKTPSEKVEPPLAKTKTENKRNIKANNQNSLNYLNSDTVKTRRKCQSKYLSYNKNGNSNSQLPDSLEDSQKTNNSKIKSKTKLVKELRNKKLSVISTKMGMKHCLRITRQRSKILENAKNSKKRIAPPTQKPQSNLTTKYITYPNSCSPYDISYRVKKITDHSIDNLRISSLTFDDVFDKAFFNRVKCNIQENLLNFVDGKVFKSVESENRISSFQKREDSPPEEGNSNCGYAMTSTPVVLIEANIIDDLESQFDSKSKKKGSASADEILPFKYFTRRKYQAVISERKGNKDLSKLDMWTQLVMKNRQQKILSDQKTDKEMVEYKKSDEYKTKVQLEELNGILDKRGPLEDLREEAMRTVALEKLNSVPAEKNVESYLDVTIILNDLLNNLFPKDTSSTDLPLSDSVRNQAIIPENKLQAEEMLNVFNLQRISYVPQRVEDGETAMTELTGEWARTRIYVCAACGLKLPNAKLLVDHKNLFHVNVWCQHYEFVGNQGELYRHLSIPGLGKIGAIEDKLVNDIWRRSDARVCSKCNKRFNCLGDLHRHMLECGGDLAWMLERKKYKYRPYGSKTRKKRRGLLRLLHAFRNHTREKRKKTIKKFTGPRQKPSDADTIQRMLANLPAKRTTRKVISLKDGFPRTVLTKKLVNANSQPIQKEVKTVVKNVKKNSNINRTRRLLRSNSSILLENNLLLPKFKRKKNENHIIQRCSLRTNKSIQKRFLTKNPIVSTCKLSDELIKTLTRNDQGSSETGSSDDGTSEDQVESNIPQNADGSPIKDTVPVNDKLNVQVEVEQDGGKSLRRKKQKNKVQSKVVRKKVSEIKGKKNFSDMSNIRKLRYRSAKILPTVSSQKFRPKIKKKTKRNFVKKSVTEIIQVDGCSQSKSFSKSDIDSKECDISSNLVVTVTNINPPAQSSDNTLQLSTSEVEPNLDENKLEPSNLENDKMPTEDNLPVPIIAPFETKIVEATPAPQPPKRIKKLRGLNDCIAMLTNKLHDKNFDSNGSNALENFCSKTIHSILNNATGGVQVESNNAPVTVQQSEEHKEPAPLIDQVMLNISIENKVVETQRSVLTESVTYEDFYCIPDKPAKVKHKRRKTRKKELKTIPEIVNDKLQENNPEFNRNCCIENQLNLEKEQVCSDSDKFSNSEKENTFSDHLHKVPKTKKTRRKYERVIQLTLPTQVESPTSIVDSHIIDVINAVATNELVDSEDEVPLAQLIKKYDVQQIEETCTSDHGEVMNLVNTDPSPIANEEVAVSEQVENEEPKDSAENVDLHQAMELFKDSNNEIESNEAPPDCTDTSASEKLANEAQETVVTAETPLLDNVQEKIPKPGTAKSKRKKKVVRKTKVKVMSKPSEVENAYCDICNKTFRRSENLLKHKRTLTHIAKLSELEALEMATNSKKLDEPIVIEEYNVMNEEQMSYENIGSVTCDAYPQSEVSATFDLGSPPETLKLVDIINDVLSKPVDTEYVEHRNFSNLVLQSDPEIKRCKSLGERKSFDCDKLQTVDTTSLPTIEDDFEDAKISNTAADVIVEKQISLLENMIEDNRKSAEFVSSDLPEYSCESNSSTFSILSDHKPEDSNEITFTHNTNIIAKLIKPTTDDVVIPSAHYEQISDDSNSSHFPIEEQKSRKVLNRDEELFLECCSLLKSSSDVSDLCRKSVKPAKFFNNFGLKPVDELEWMEQKQIPIAGTLLDHTTATPLNLTHSNTPVCDTFYSDVTFSNTDNSNSKIFLEKSDNNFFTQPPMFEDISTESDDSSRKSMTNSKSVATASAEYNGNANFGNEDRSSPNVESAQIPCEDSDQIEVECDNVRIVENQRQNEEEALQPVEIQDDVKSPSPTPLQKSEGVKIIQSNITDYVVTKNVKKHENKKLLTKGALKVFEGLKVSIPKGDLDMKEVLSCSPTSKRLEIEAEQDKIAEKKSHTRKDFINRNFIFNNILKNGKKVNNKLGLKVTKKRYNAQKHAKVIKASHDKKSHDVYDFEETQDSVDMFMKNSDSLPDYHSFKNKISCKLGLAEDVDENESTLPKSKEDMKKTTLNNSNLPPSRKLKMNKTITKKKCMIMGRIFKNALKPKAADEMKNIPAIDNSKIVENFVMDCHNLQNTSQTKHKLTEEEMNLLFDSLLNEDNCNGASKETLKNDHTAEVKSVDTKPKSKANRPKKRQRAHSSDSSDEEFSIKKSSKKQVNRKSSNNDCVINLEQELKECIGVASRKSQRKCTSGKQNVLVEYWSSDESNFDYESVTMLDNVINTNPVEDVPANPFTQIITSAIDATEMDEGNHLDDLSVKEDADDKSKEMKKRCFKTKHFRKKSAIATDKTIEGRDSVTIASTRQKRNAADTLYYWSSSSEDEMQDIIEVKPLRDDGEDDDRPTQQGWIVGDSPKKLVTMLAQAKGKKLDVEYVKKNRKKRTTL
ncbi:uncharacterized protein LOC116173642 [Photinus pyralis]|nr:uncharacterized protein LOC116173642 [Photinus pyralis]